MYVYGSLLTFEPPVKKSSLCCLTINYQSIDWNETSILINMITCEDCSCSMHTWYFDIILYLRISMYFANIHLIYALQKLTTESNTEKAQVQ